MVRIAILAKIAQDVKHVKASSFNQMESVSLNVLILCIHMVEYVTHASFHAATAQMLILVLHALQIIYLSEAAHAFLVLNVQVATIYNKV